MIKGDPSSWTGIFSTDVEVAAPNIILECNSFELDART